MQEADKDMLERIFSDAQIKDIDLSEWDKHVTLCVLSDHYRQWSGRCPVLLVRFDGVGDLVIAFRHLSEPPLRSNQHFQWLVEAALIETSPLRKLTLESALRSGPILALSFTSAHVVEVDHRELDKAFPKWDRSDTGFVRPGLERLMPS